MNLLNLFGRACARATDYRCGQNSPDPRQGAYWQLYSEVLWAEAHARGIDTSLIAKKRLTYARELLRRQLDEAFNCHWEPGELERVHGYWISRAQEELEGMEDTLRFLGVTVPRSRVLDKRLG